MTAVERITCWNCQLKLQWNCMQTTICFHICMFSAETEAEEDGLSLKKSWLSSYRSFPEVLVIVLCWTYSNFLAHFCTSWIQSLGSDKKCTNVVLLLNIAPIIIAAIKQRFPHSPAWHLECNSLWFIVVICDFYIPHVDNTITINSWPWRKEHSIAQLQYHILY